MKTKTLFLAVVFLFLGGLFGCEKEYTDVAGLWDTSWGMMTLTQSASGDVTGTYDYDSGAIQGKLTGTTLSGTWTETNSQGTFVFEFNPQFTTFDGVWGYDNETPTHDDWFGTRVE
ncbi:MAG: hypothetical protein U5L72_07670 [Bacteroidales bacterium]|nr:hypothetical protein [Bacteroidales bacterium]